MKTVFITGASGYIGGDILAELISKYPALNYRLLVRSEKNGQKIKEVYPQVTVVQGDLDDSELLTKESAAADIIIHTADAADHLPAAKAIAKGAIQGHTPERPVYWLHTSGAGLLSFHDTENKIYGEKGEIIYDDIKDIKKILSFPDRAFHKEVDNTVFEAAAQSPAVLKTVIISPTTVYGKGKGPCYQRSRQVYEMAKFILEHARIPIIGKGQAIGSNIHVHSVTSLFRLLFEFAIQEKPEENSIWGPEAYYLVEEGEHCWGDVAHSIGRIAVDKKFLDSEPKPIALEMDSAQELAGFEATSWAYNMRCRASRARSFGWQPSGPSLEEELPGIVEEEYKRLHGVSSE